MGRFTEQGNGEKELIFQLSGMRSESEKEIVRVKNMTQLCLEVVVFFANRKKGMGSFPYHMLNLFVVLQRRLYYLYTLFFCKLKRSAQQEGAELLKSH